jgi:cardiolipin synthase A/B
MNHVSHVAGHTIRLLRNGSEYFPRLAAAIDAATHSVYLETYIFASDVSGRMIADTLRRAAERGVVVHLLLDGFGCAGFPSNWADELTAAGVQLLWFRPEIARLSLRRYRLRRLHRKLAVMDERIAFVGGINIIDDDSDALGAPRLDYAVEIEGETVARIHASMRRLWGLVSWSSLRKRVERDKPYLRLPVPKQRQVNFLFRDNLRHRNDIEQAYLSAIADARNEIVIANAYFLPGRHFRQTLLDAVRRGVRVILMLQGRLDHPLLHYATQALYDELLEAGVEIHEYHTSFMHAKVAVIDGYWATVGSSNIDPFSMWLAREGNLVVRDGDFSATLRASLLQEMERGARLVRRAVWSRQFFLIRLIPRISYALVRLIIGLVGYGSERDNV